MDVNFEQRMQLEAGAQRWGYQFLLQKHRAKPLQPRVRIEKQARRLSRSPSVRRKPQTSPPSSTPATPSRATPKRQTPVSMLVIYMYLKVTPLARDNQSSTPHCVRRPPSGLNIRLRVEITTAIYSGLLLLVTRAVQQGIPRVPL